MPAPFDAQPNAATRVRSVSMPANSFGSTTHTSGSIPTWRTVTPRSSAASSHGATFASWSRPVTSTSSPGPSSRKSVREACIVSVVMLAPNTISPACGAEEGGRLGAGVGEHLVGGDDVANGPPRLAFCSR